MYDISIKQYFKKHKKYSRSQYYFFKKRIYGLLDKQYFEWKNSIGMLPIRKTMTYKYDAYARSLIKDYYNKYCQMHTNFEITDFWCQIRIQKVLEARKRSFSNITINTLKMILKQELGLIFVKTKLNTVKHPKGKWMVEPGHVQLDLKILGKNETGVKKRISVFNMLETRSRFSYSFILENESAQNIMDALKLGVSYFRKNKITIKSIQTDNAMLFKGTNFIHQNDFIKYLNNQKIVKRLIPLGKPQCNGCIERFHRTMDIKCHVLFKAAKTLDEIKQTVFIFSHEYNFKRFHYYSELEHLSFDQRYLIPKNAINSNIMSHEVDLSKKMVY